MDYMDRVKRLSTELLENYPDRFTTNFEENKKTILSIAIIRSKILRNKMAGYITSKLAQRGRRGKISLRLLRKSNGRKLETLITLKLLGGVKFAVGKNSVVIDKSQSTVKEIIEELKNEAIEPKILNEKNLMVSVNGIDSSVTGGKETVIKTGDVITIVTIIHGG